MLAQITKIIMAMSSAKVSHLFTVILLSFFSLTLPTHIILSVLWRELFSTADTVGERVEVGESATGWEVKGAFGEVVHGSKM